MAVRLPWGSLALVNLLLLAGFTLLQAQPLPHLSGTAEIPEIPVYWLLANGLAVLVTLVRSRIIAPWRRMRQLLLHASQLVAEERGERPSAPLGLNGIASEMARIAALAQETHGKYQEVRQELETSRQMLAQYDVQQRMMIDSTSREISEQYQSVLSYANYLDEYIAQKTADTTLRLDFDDVCESSFNLKLIAQAMEGLRRPHSPKLSAVPLDTLLQQTMLALAPSLERRSMQLSSAGVEHGVIACTDAGTIAHVLWMMLLGTIRYAEAESTLRLRCFHSADRTKTLISLVVSELAPGQLTPAERHAYMLRRLASSSAHMFSETIRKHGNIQLAELMMKPLGGTLEIVPLSSHACEICLVLPAV